MLPEKSINQDEPYFISIKRGAQILQISERTLHQYIHDGCGPPVRYFGNGQRQLGRIRFKDFMDWANNFKPRRKKQNV